MNTLDLGHMLPRFFTEHLMGQRNVSPRTVAAYRDVFRLMLRFLQRSRKSAASNLPLSALSAQSVLNFLNHLEKERHNSIRSRNTRLMALRSFVHYASDLLGPELPESTRRILAIPSKRWSRPLLGFLSRDEVQAILAETNGSWTGRRDHLLFLLLYNTGAPLARRHFGTDGLKQMIEFGGAPSSPLKIGQSWVTDRELNAGVIGTFRLNLTNTFAGWQQHENKKCARINITGTLTSVSSRNLTNFVAATPAMKIQNGKVTGKSWFDPQLGIAVETVLDQNFEIGRASCRERV